MKKIVFTKYETKVRGGESSVRWGVSMLFPALRDAFDDHLASLKPEQLKTAGFSAKAEDLETLGEPSEQALAMLVNTLLTSKISSAALAEKTEDEIRAYAAKNFVKIATESKSRGEAISEAVNAEQDWFTIMATKAGELNSAAIDAALAGNPKEGKALRAEAKLIEAEMIARKKPTV